MALDITPGPIPKDGVAFQDVENELTAFVNQTVITNVGPDNFSENIPFIFSASEPPSNRTAGMLWFNLSEGRLYTWWVNGPSGASFSHQTDEDGITSPGMDPEHWICMSDRKEIFGLHHGFHAGIPLLPYGTTGLALRYAESRGAAPGGLTPSKIDDEERFAYTQRLDASPPFSNFYYSPFMSIWGPLIFTDKYFVHTTNYTVPGTAYVSGAFHELGFRRAAVAAPLEGSPYPDYGSVQAGATTASDHDTRIFEAIYRIPKTLNETTTSIKVCYIAESVSTETLTTALCFWYSRADETRAKN